jgi:hypothetical protein
MLAMAGSLLAPAVITFKNRTRIDLVTPLARVAGTTVTHREGHRFGFRELCFCVVPATPRRGFQSGFWLDGHRYTSWEARADSLPVADLPAWARISIRGGRCFRDGRPLGLQCSAVGSGWPLVSHTYIIDGSEIVTGWTATLGNEKWTVPLQVSIVPTMINALCYWTCGVVSISALSAFRSRTRSRRGLCQECGHSYQGTTASKCCECGCVILSRV